MYLRTLLIHGARALLRVRTGPHRAATPWLAGLLARRPRNMAAVALAHKNARIVWALLAHECEYHDKYRPQPVGG